MPKLDAILVLNAGSSSLKFQVFALEGHSLTCLQRGQIDGIGTRPAFIVKDSDGTVLVDETWLAEEMPDLPSAIDRLGDWIDEISDIELRALGHRVVHGGPDFSRPVLITPATVEKLSTYQELAPLHQPNNLAPIKLAMSLAPELPQVACFDTAFHRGHPETAEYYALPAKYREAGVRRYGFHGLSYEYISQEFRGINPKAAQGRVIVAHLGSGASMCALQNGKSIESTMGFTALDGLPMGTRPGQLDPGVVLHLIQHHGMTVEQVSDLLYHESGLKGLSGISNDIRDLLASDDPNAQFALDYFTSSCGLYIGTLAAALEGLDALVFTAGIGENSVEIRRRIVERMAWLGAVIDPEANALSKQKISAPDSQIAIYIVPTDEELIIAKGTVSTLREADLL